MTFPSPIPPRKGPSGPEWVYPTASNQVGNPAPLPSKEGYVLAVQPDGTLAPVPASSTLSHLTSIMFVDGATTVPTANQNGNDEAPFKTVGQAITACPAGGAILIAKGVYAEDLVIGKNLILQSIGTPVPTVSDLHALSPSSVQVGNVTVTTAGVTVALNGIQHAQLIGNDNATISFFLNTCVNTAGITNPGGEGAPHPRVTANNSFIGDMAFVDFLVSNNTEWAASIHHSNSAGSQNCYFQNSSFSNNPTLVFTRAGTVELDEISNQNFLAQVLLTNGTKNIRGDEATLARITPQVVPGAGGGGFITLLQEDNTAFTYHAVGLTVNQKLEVGIDATTIDQTTLAITELRANRSYWITGGALTLLNDSTVFTSADLQFVIAGTDLDLQINQAAAAGHTKRAVGKVYVKVVDI